MNVSQVYAVYFSATGNTRNISKRMSVSSVGSLNCAGSHVTFVIYFLSTIRQEHITSRHVHLDFAWDD